MCKQISRGPKFRSAASVALAHWLASTGKSQGDLARRLDISRQRASNYVRGYGPPKSDVATRLQKMTKGAVRLADWRVPAVDQ